LISSIIDIDTIKAVNSSDNISLYTNAVGGSINIDVASGSPLLINTDISGNVTFINGLIDMSGCSLDITGNIVCSENIDVSGNIVASSTSTLDINNIQTTSTTSSFDLYTNNTATSTIGNSSGTINVNSNVNLNNTDNFLGSGSAYILAIQALSFGISPVLPLTSFSVGSINSTSSSELLFDIPSGKNFFLFAAAAVYSTTNASYFICTASCYFAVGISLSSTTSSFSCTCGSSYGGTNDQLTLTINKGYTFGYYITG
jgi:hypothetical protein